MSNKLISIIVPIYNTGKFLNKCLDSIINQTYKNFELILVDDGSTDNSKSICERYIKKHRNIKYFYQSNSGQGSARNFGISMAKFEYIIFIDSDDYIEKDTLETLLMTAEDTDSDIVYCDFFRVNNSKVKLQRAIFNPKYDDKTNYLLENAGPCNALIRRDLIKNINFRFPENIIYEDLAIIPILGMEAKKVSYVNKPFYNYVMRDNSTMNQKSYNIKLEDIFKSIDILLKNYKSRKLEYNEILEYIIIRRLMSASLRFIEFNDPSNCIKKISNVVSNNFPNWAKNRFFKELNLKQRVMGHALFKNQKIILCLLYKLNQKILVRK